MLVKRFRKKNGRLIRQLQQKGLYGFRYRYTRRCDENHLYAGIYMVFRAWRGHLSPVDTSSNLESAFFSVKMSR